MNVKEIADYIAYLKNFKDQLLLDQSNYFEQNIQVLTLMLSKLNETLATFAYTVIYNEGELKFPKAYFELHKDSLFGLEFDNDTDEDFVIIKLLTKPQEVEDDGEAESVSTDGEGS